MEVGISVALPRDAGSVPLARRVLSHALDTMGVDPEVRGDLELALSEACANVLKHAQEGDNYAVTGTIDEDRCVLEVRDDGIGFDGADHGRGPADESAETGRGIQLMRALVDSVSFSAGQTAGTVVHLEKALVWREGTPLLSAGAAASDGGGR